MLTRSNLIQYVDSPDFLDTPQELSYTALGDNSDYYFIYGKTHDGIIADMRELTGHAPMLPLWTYGFFQFLTGGQEKQEQVCTIHL